MSNEEFSPFGVLRHLPCPPRLAPLAPAPLRVYDPQPHITPPQPVQRQYHPMSTYQTQNSLIEPPGPRMHPVSHRPTMCRPEHDMRRFEGPQCEPTNFNSAGPSQSAYPMSYGGYTHGRGHWEEYHAPPRYAPYHQRGPYESLTQSPQCGPCGVTQSSQWCDPSSQESSRTSRVRVPWTEEEEIFLRKTVAAVGRRWKAVAAIVKRRTEHQCRERWRRFMRKEAQMRADETSVPCSIRRTATYLSIEGHDAGGGTPKLDSDGETPTRTPPQSAPAKESENSPV
mmetsp:Transcript_23039/g.53858  ORF Transcript_23039/g.53858 Transcript_23039/m.53858 type:complete len:283 (+) Transcript_23039:70-918(+)